MNSQTLTYKLIDNKAFIISLNGEPVLLYNQPQSTLLQALELKKVNIYSECRSGFCGACKTTINRGTVSYLNPPLARLKSNECLPCCCIPNSDIDLDLEPYLG